MTRALAAGSKRSRRAADQTLQTARSRNSLDELATGFTLGLLRLPTLLVIALIGAQAFILSQLGLRLGARVGSEVREGAERLAGLALTVLSVGLLVHKIASG